MHTFFSAIRRKKNLTSDSVKQVKTSDRSEEIDEKGKDKQTNRQTDKQTN